jgi:hypothetical protein
MMGAFVDGHWFGTPLKIDGWVQCPHCSYKVRSRKRYEPHFLHSTEGGGVPRQAVDERFHGPPPSRPAPVPPTPEERT